MVQPATEKLKHTSRETLCDTCKNAVPQLCVYMRSKPKDAEAALAAMGVERNKYTWTHASCGVYRVTSCPKYVPGALPRMAEGRPAPRRETELLDKISAGYDFSCPHCGGISGVKVARISLLKPEDWYCRCSNCVKSFRPRKKEVKKLELVNESAISCNESAISCNENAVSCAETCCRRWTNWPSMRAAV
ncbi:MAG: hypothetical protein GX425_00710 [Peptococcaceae bacterium]|nr:hypothetical protein [Peptococcaceae bacterium]